MIGLTQLRTFDAVARHRHFTRAAEELQVAQPSVSYQIQALERALKVDLVEVIGRRVFLTEAGERLALRARSVLNELEDTERELRDFRLGVVGRLRIGATRTIGGYALPEVLGSFCRAHPGIEIQLTIDNTRVIEDLLLSRAVDVGVVEGKIVSPTLDVQPLKRDALVLVVPVDHPFSTRSSLRRHELSGQPMIWREPGSGTRALAEEALGPVIGTVRTVLESDQPEAILRAVEAGLGLAFISQVIVDRHIAAGWLVAVPIEDVDLWRDFSLVTLRDRPVSPSLKAFQEHIRQKWAG